LSFILSSSSSGCRMEGFVSVCKLPRPASSSRMRSVRISIRSWSSSEPERTKREPLPVVRHPSGQMAARSAEEVESSVNGRNIKDAWGRTTTAFATARAGELLVAFQFESALTSVSVDAFQQLEGGNNTDRLHSLHAWLVFVFFFERCSGGGGSSAGRMCWGVKASIGVESTVGLQPRLPVPPSCASANACSFICDRPVSHPLSEFESDTCFRPAPPSGSFL
jgi:hypothetical protein